MTLSQTGVLTTADNVHAGTKGYYTTATGTTSITASTGIKQTYSEGWTAIFADFEPHQEWGLYHDNPSNKFIVSAGSSTNNIYSFSVVNHGGTTRTAYAKIILDQSSGLVSSGGGYSVGTTNVIDSSRQISNVTALCLGQDISAMDTANLDLDIVNHASIRGASALYFGVTTNSYNSWKTRIGSNNTSTMYISSQGLIHNNSGYGTSTFFTSNSTGMNIQTGGLLIDSITAIDASRNITAGTISSGDITCGNIASGVVTINTTSATALNIDSSANSVLVPIGGSAQTAYVDLQLITDGGNGEIFKGGTLYSGWGGLKALNIYNSDGVIAFHPSGTANVLQITSTVINATKPIQISGQTVIDASRNLTNIDTATIGAASEANMGKLHIKSGDSGATPYQNGNSGIVVETTGRAAINLLTPNNQDSYVFFADPQSANAGYIGYEHSNNTLVLKSETYVKTSGSGLNVSAGVLQMSGTTVIDASRVITATSATFIGDLTTSKPSHNYMRVESSGSGEAMIRYKNTTNNYWYVGLRTSVSNSITTTGYHIYSTTAGQTVAGWNADRNFYTSNNLTAAGNITAYSDERLKENIQTLDGKKVLQMRGVSFTKDGEFGSGVIAQELEKIAPELVHDGEYKSVAYGNITGYLIEAVKEQQKEIDELKLLVKQLLEK